MSDREDKKKVPMDEEAKKRIMSAEGKKTGGIYDKDGHVPRMQRAADKNEEEQKKKVPMDDEAKARIMSAEGKKTGGIFDKDGHVPRMQGAADRNEEEKKKKEEEKQLEMAQEKQW